MKRLAALILALMFVFGLVGCNNRNMNYIITHEPSVTGTVKEVHDNYMIIYLKTDGYPNGARCAVSLNAENKDSYTDVAAGDEVIVYYNGEIAESYPLRISTVYAINLTVPASREAE